MMFLGMIFFSKLGRKLLPPHPVAQGDGHGALGGVLSDHVFIEFSDNLARSQVVQRELFVFSSCREINSHKNPVASD